MIISPSVDTLMIDNRVIRKDVHGIKEYAYDFDALKRAKVERARSILILSEAMDSKMNKVNGLYRDAEVTLVYKTVCDYLIMEKNWGKIKNDINIEQIRAYVDNL